MSNTSRRAFLGMAAAGTGLAANYQSYLLKEQPQPPFRFMLNTSTIRGQKQTLAQEIDIAAKAGYDAIEPWLGELEQVKKDGGSLKDLKKRVADHGLTVESSIGFARWIVDDETERKKGLEQARRDMDLVLQLGGKRIAAPPVGATEELVKDPLKIAERYRKLCDIGAEIGVVPQVELWGFSKTLHRLGETACAALESGHPQACILADVYHLHKGGSGFAGVKLLSGTALQIFHLNDYPAKPDRATITDADRVYPGDGVAPLRQMLRDLRGIGFRGYLSLELFNPTYWKQDPLEVARTGLEKMKAVVKASQQGL
jgi:sugar phosphate isomerase/epimerase